MRRVQFTIRRLMIAVAVIAVLVYTGIEGVRLSRFRRDYLGIANFHASDEQFWLAAETSHRKLLASLEQQERETRVELPADAQYDQLRVQLKRSDDRFQQTLTRARNTIAGYAELAAYHAALKEKYLRAADRPWRFVEPDAPEPIRPE